MFTEQRPYVSAEAMGAADKDGIDQNGFCGGYAAIVGYFYAKSIKENKKGYAVLGFAIAFLMHGLYDFSLSEEAGAVSDVFALVALLLAVLDVVIIIALIVFIRKHEDDPKYCR